MRICPWDSPGKNTEVSCHSLLQGILPTQESNPGLQHCRWILHHLSHHLPLCKREPLQCIFNMTARIILLKYKIDNVTQNLPTSIRKTLQWPTRFYLICTCSPLLSVLTSCHGAHHSSHTALPLVLKHTGQAPTAGPLYFLVPMPRTTPPSISSWLTPSLPSSHYTNTTLPEHPSLNALLYFSP